MVEDGCFEGFAAGTTSGFFFQSQVLLPDVKFLDVIREISVSINCVSIYATDLLLKFLEFFGRLRLFGQCPFVQLGLDGLRQVLGDELLDHIPLVIHDAVDAEVQVGAIELEHATKEALVFFQVTLRIHTSPLLC